jgi:hypothetical protein
MKFFSYTIHTIFIGILVFFIFANLFHKGDIFNKNFYLIETLPFFEINNSIQENNNKKGRKNQKIRISSCI